MVAALFYPEAFQRVGDFELKKIIVPLIQVIMFGMGAMLSLADFQRVLTMPRAVLIGMALQFSIMPLVGAGLACRVWFPGRSGSRSGADRFVSWRCRIQCNDLSIPG